MLNVIVTFGVCVNRRYFTSIQGTFDPELK